jgi:transposase/DNA-binding CsgD family transcriptional regulator
MINYQTYCKIRLFHLEGGLSMNQIGCELGIDPETVAKYAKEATYPCRRKTKRASKLDPFKPAILRDFELAGCSVSTIYNHLRPLGYTGGYSIIKQYINRLRGIRLLKDDKLLLPSEWMLRILQGKTSAHALAADLGLSDHEHVEILLGSIRNGSLRVRNRALAILAHMKKIPACTITRFLMIDKGVIPRYLRAYELEGDESLTANRRSGEKKHEQRCYKDAVFTLLHSPPHDHGVNRTSWRMEDLKRLLREQGILICKETIRKIIKDAGFRFRTAKRVLTSTDPEYRQKLVEVTRILSELSDFQKFFSIDEYGPFSVKLQGGRALTGPGAERIVPQWQKSKGSLTLVGALELSTNQITHFYSTRKSTAEMIQLMHLLLVQYNDQSLLYLSWDAASWHASKAFVDEVALVNTDEYRSVHQTPAIALVPLPSCAQFLNVIESVFSGMAKAIIHNSDYASVDDCKNAIVLYLTERNQFFKNHPKRAGDKIWGKERVPSVFNLGNNCKDPNYR